MSEPAQKPHRSKQDYQTPPEFIAAVVGRFGPIAWDLAASPSNAVGDGSYFTEQQDSLAQDWTDLTDNLWLNPPFARIRPWASKCRQSAGLGRRIFLLTPAAVGSNWFAEHVHGHALVLGLSPRIKFVGEKAGYPKDLILSVFSDRSLVGFDVWRWK